MHCVALLKLKVPHALSRRDYKPMVLCTYPPQCKAIHDSPSLLPKLEENQVTWSNILHTSTYGPTFRAFTPLTQVHYVPKGTREHNALA